MKKRREESERNETDVCKMLQRSVFLSSLPPQAEVNTSYARTYITKYAGSSPPPGQRTSNEAFYAQITTSPAFAPPHTFFPPLVSLITALVASRLHFLCIATSRCLWIGTPFLPLLFRFIILIPISSHKFSRVYSVPFFPSLEPSRLVSCPCHIHSVEPPIQHFQVRYCISPHPLPSGMNVIITTNKSVLHIEVRLL